MSEFAGVGQEAYFGPYTWGLDTPRPLFDVRTGQAPMDGSKFPARDDFDGEWLLVEIGQMVPLTPELRKQKENGPRTIPQWQLVALRDKALALFNELNELLRKTN